MLPYLEVILNFFQEDGNDPIVITMQITNFEVKRISVDNGAAVEIMSWEAFKAMHIDESNLKPAKPVFRFANKSKTIKGQITLLVTLG